MLLTPGRAGRPADPGRKGLEIPGELCGRPPGLWLPVIIIKEADNQLNVLERKIIYMLAQF
jgi:hypothetical protein